jgi:hypothetical protein
LRVGDSLAEIRVPTPDSVGLFGGVDEQKEERERARNDGALRYTERVDLTQQIVERRSSPLAVTASPRSGAKALDDLERLLSLESLNDASQRAGQPANIFVERNVFSSRGHRHSTLNYAASTEKLIPLTT